MKKVLIIVGGIVIILATVIIAILVTHPRVIIKDATYKITQGVNECAIWGYAEDPQSTEKVVVGLGMGKDENTRTVTKVFLSVKDKNSNETVSFTNFIFDVVTSPIASDMKIYQKNGMITETTDNIDLTKKLGQDFLSGSFTFSFDRDGKMRNYDFRTAIPSTLTDDFLKCTKIFMVELVKEQKK